MKLRSLYEGKTLQFSPDAKAFLDKGMSLIVKRLTTRNYKWVAQNINKASGYPIEHIEEWAKKHLEKSGKIPFHPMFNELLLKAEVDPGEQYGDPLQISLYAGNNNKDNFGRDGGRRQAFTSQSVDGDFSIKSIYVIIDKFEKPIETSEVRYVLTHEIMHAIDPKGSVDRRDLPWKRVNKRNPEYSYVDDPIEIDPLIKQYSIWYVDRGIEYLMGEGLTWEEAIDALRHRNIASLKGMGGFKPARRIIQWREENKPVFRKFMRAVFDYVESLK